MLFWVTDPIMGAPKPNAISNPQRSFHFSIVLGLQSPRLWLTGKAMADKQDRKDIQENLTKCSDS